MIQTELETGLSAQRIHQALAAQVGFTGSYQSVERSVGRVRIATPERVWHIEFQPSEEAPVDLGTAGWVIDTVSGVRRRSWSLRVVLSLSRKAYSEASSYGSAYFPEGCRRINFEDPLVLCDQLTLGMSNKALGCHPVGNILRFRARPQDTANPNQKKDRCRAFER